MNLMMKLQKDSEIIPVDTQSDEGKVGSITQYSDEIAGFAKYLKEGTR